MTINNVIEETLESLFRGSTTDVVTDNKMIDAAKLYLLSIWYGLNDGIIPETVIRKVNLTKICERDYEAGTVKWNIPLFSTTNEVDVNWDWVNTEYRNLFKDLRKEAAGDLKGTIGKMKKFFAEYPHVRKEDVIAAANAYLEAFRRGQQSIAYLQQADYFINKKADGVITSRLLTYLELIQSERTEGTSKGMRGLVK